MQASAGIAAAVLRSLGNERRLLILCTLIGSGENSAGELADAVGLSPSATSQHLSRMREDGLLESRREAQSVLYRIADPNLVSLIKLLKDLYCS
ncbi:MAG: helix-turn-helix transcriptional regulator [Caldilineaceae bacterium]|nr:helix-turn-helix transcriptional regulator [Caldilineaceae bacterium]